MMRTRLYSMDLSAAILFSIICGGAGLASRPVQAWTDGQGCRLRPGGTSAVVEIVDAQTLKLADGRYVRLTGIFVPRAKPMEPNSFQAQAAAIKLLREVALGMPAEIAFGGAERDRYGITLAQVRIAASPAVWLQEKLVASGLVQARPQKDNHACNTALLAAEALARAQKKGLWGRALFKVHPVDSSKQFWLLYGLAQSFQLIEGKVGAVRKTGGRTVLQFGEASRRSVMAMVDGRDAKLFKQLDASKDSLMSLQGKRIRLRGWLDRKAGHVVLSLQHPSQMEILSEDAKE